MEHTYESDVFRIRSFGQILADPKTEEEWCVDELLVRGGISILAAKPKVGKTTIAIDLAVCIAQGKPFLNRFKTDQGGVLFLALEEIPSRFIGNLETRGADASDLIWAHIGLPGRPNATEELSKVCEELKPKLVIIDHVSLFLKINDINDYSEVNHIIASLREVARSSNVHIMLMHHMNKKSSDQDGLLGSTALSGAVDMIITLTTDQGGNRFIATTPRYGIHMEKTMLAFDSSTLGFNLNSELSNKSTGDHSAIRERVIRYLSDKQDVPQVEILNEVKGNKQIKINAIKELEFAGRLKVSTSCDGHKVITLLTAHTGSEVPAPRGEEPQNLLIGKTNTPPEYEV